MKEERHLTVKEVAAFTGYTEATLRKFILRRQVGYRKGRRKVTIPESEAIRLLGKYHPPVPAGEAAQ